MTTTNDVWLSMVLSLLFWVALVAGISYLVARAVVRRELHRATFVSSEPGRQEPPPEEPPLPDKTPQGPHGPH